MNQYACMGMAFARALKMKFSEVAAFAGHNGGGEGGHLGFHPQECIDVATLHGFSCTPIQLFVGMLYGSETKPVVIWPKEDAIARFEYYVNKTKCGVLEGLRVKSENKGVVHAVALLDGIVYDNDLQYPVAECAANNFHPQTLWIIERAANETE